MVYLSQKVKEHLFDLAVTVLELESNDRKKLKDLLKWQSHSITAWSISNGASLFELSKILITISVSRRSNFLSFNHSLKVFSDSDPSLGFTKRLAKSCQQGLLYLEDVFSELVNENSLLVLEIQVKVLRLGCQVFHIVIVVYILWIDAFYLW